MNLKLGRIGQRELLGAPALAAGARLSGESRPPLLQVKRRLPGDGGFHRAIAR